VVIGSENVGNISDLNQCKNLKQQNWAVFFMLTVNPLLGYYKKDYLYQLSIKYPDSDYEFTLHFLIVGKYLKDRQFDRLI